MAGGSGTQQTITTTHQPVWPAILVMASMWNAAPSTSASLCIHRARKTEGRLTIT